MDRDVGSVDGEELNALVHSIHLASAIADEQEEAFELLADPESQGFEASGHETSLALLTTMGRRWGAPTIASSVGSTTAPRIWLAAATPISRSSSTGVWVFLTIISAVFMPLTLLAGIWGMNFEHMPELGHEYAYPAALSLMAAVAGGSAWAFYKYGWFATKSMS